MNVFKRTCERVCIEIFYSFDASHDVYSIQFKPIYRCIIRSLVALLCIHYIVCWVLLCGQKRLGFYCTELFTFSYVIVMAIKNVPTAYELNSWHFLSDLNNFIFVLSVHFISFAFCISAKWLSTFKVEGKKNCGRHVRVCICAIVYW